MEVTNTIANVVFLAGATQFKDDFNIVLNKVVCGRVINCFSKSDVILSTVYAAVIPIEPTGRTPNKNLSMENYEFELGHTKYRENFSAVRDRLALEFI